MALRSLCLDAIGSGCSSREEIISYVVEHAEGEAPSRKAVMRTLNNEKEGKVAHVQFAFDGERFAMLPHCKKCWRYDFASLSGAKKHERACKADAGQAGDAEAPVAEEEVEEEPEYVVDHIISERIHRKKLQYEVQWGGEYSDEVTWEPQEHLDNTAALAKWKRKGRKEWLAAQEAEAAEPEEDDEAEAEGGGGEEGGQDEEKEGEAAPVGPHRGSLRWLCFHALCAGHSSRDDIVDFASARRTLLRSEQRASADFDLRPPIVALLGKEKRMGEVLWEQEGSEYSLTPAGEAFRPSDTEATEVDAAAPGSKARKKAGGGEKAGKRKEAAVAAAPPSAVPAPAAPSAAPAASAKETAIAVAKEAASEAAASPKRKRKEVQQERQQQQREQLQALQARARAEAEIYGSWGMWVDGTMSWPVEERGGDEQHVGGVQDGAEAAGSRLADGSAPVDWPGQASGRAASKASLKPVPVVAYPECVRVAAGCCGMGRLSDEPRMLTCAACGAHWQSTWWYDYLMSQPQLPPPPPLPLPLPPQAESARAFTGGSVPSDAELRPSAASPSAASPAAASPAAAGPSQPPPLPPAGWIWPEEGESIEVLIADPDGSGGSAAERWVAGVVRAVLVDSWFCIRIVTKDDAWDDWFTWEEEGVDWRRIAPPTGRGRSGSMSAGRSTSGATKRTSRGGEGSGGGGKSPIRARQPGVGATATAEAPSSGDGRVGRATSRGVTAADRAALRGSRASPRKAEEPPWQLPNLPEGGGIEAVDLDRLRREARERSAAARKRPRVLAELADYFTNGPKGLT